MKKILVSALSLLLVLACLTGCSSSGLTLKALQSKGSLTIATSPDFPPFESLDGNGVVAGIEIDIMQKICEDLGVELKIEQMDFDSVLPGIQAGKFDVGVSGISVTPAREKNTLFTIPYCLAAQAIVVKEGSPITCKADLDGKKVSVQTGTTAETFCTENGYDVYSYTANDDAKLAAVMDKVDAWVIDDLTAAEMVALYNAENDTKLVILDEAMTTEPYAFALKLGGDEVAKAMSDSIQKMLDDGTIAAIFEKYEAPFTNPNTLK